MNPCISLDIHAIERNLKTRSFGRRIEYRESIGSTNDLAKELADAGAPEGTIVVAELQTMGRGRMSRSWFAPPCSSILLTAILHPRLPASQLSRIPIAFGIGLAAAVNAQTGLDARLKWPNDLMINGRKCAGILAESRLMDDRVDYAVVGLGLNVNFSAISIEGIPVEATTLADELGRSFPREPLVRAVLEECEARYQMVQAGKSMSGEWRDRSCTLAHRIRAMTPWGEESGIADDIDEDGGLILRRDDGTAIRLTASDVSITMAPGDRKET